MAETDQFTTSCLSAVFMHQNRIFTNQLAPLLADLDMTVFSRSAFSESIFPMSCAVVKAKLVSRADLDLSRENQSECE